MRDVQASLPEHDGAPASRDCGAVELGMEINDFDLPPFCQQGRLGRVHQLFGAELPTVIEELNRELVA
jgi:type I restriction enzyme, R subunit